jgi:hypothetical protein
MKTILIFIVLLIPSLALSEEVRVVDKTGLLRAISNIKDECSVTVTINSNASNSKANSATLKNIDGTASDIFGTFQAPNMIIFSNVSSGKWKIFIEPSDLGIVDVRIAK